MRSKTAKLLLLNTTIWLRAHIYHVQEVTDLLAHHVGRAGWNRRLVPSWADEERVLFQAEQPRRRNAHQGVTEGISGHEEVRETGTVGRPHQGDDRRRLLSADVRLKAERRIDQRRGIGMRRPRDRIAETLHRVLRRTAEERGHERVGAHERRLDDLQRADQAQLPSARHATERRRPVVVKAIERLAEHHVADRKNRRCAQHEIVERAVLRQREHSRRTTVQHRRPRMQRWNEQRSLILDVRIVREVRIPLDDRLERWIVMRIPRRRAEAIEIDDGESGRSTGAADVDRVRSDRSIRLLCERRCARHQHEDPRS